MKSPTPTAESTVRQSDEFRAAADDLTLQAALALCRAVEARDPYTLQHGQHVAFYSVQLARSAGIDDKSIEEIHLAAMLHDVGKIGVPDCILRKRDKLTREEFDVVKCHAAVGAEIIGRVTALRPQAQLILHHHENWDGSGYPSALHATQIPLGARIIRVADSIDAMLSNRSYKVSYELSRVVDEVTLGGGRLYDPTLAVRAAEWCRQNPKLLQHSEAA